MFRDGPGLKVLEDYKLQLTANIYSLLGWKDEGEHVTRCGKLKIIFGRFMTGSSFEFGEECGSESWRWTLSQSND